MPRWTNFKIGQLLFYVEKYNGVISGFNKAIEID
jgi:hypothetical protein